MNIGANNSLSFSGIWGAAAQPGFLLTTGSGSVSDQGMLVVPAEPRPRPYALALGRCPDLPQSSCQSPSLRGHNFHEEVSAKISEIKKWMGKLSPVGLRSYRSYRALYLSFSTPAARLQFLAAHPQEIKKLSEYARLPEKYFMKLGLTKTDFLAFSAFARLCHLRELSEKDEFSALIPMEGAPEDIQRSAAEIKWRLSNPRPLYPENFGQNAEKFRRLAGLNSSPHVFFAFDYPDYIWIARMPLPPKFCIRNTRYGKWVVTAATEGEIEAIAKKALPYLSRHQLGVIKFELVNRGRHLRLLAYANEADGDTRDVVARISGKRPFWVPDEFCYEAEPLAKALRNLLRQAKTFGIPEGLAPYDKETAMRMLADDLKCEKLGLSNIQREIVRRLLESESPGCRDSDNAYSHVIEGYFEIGVPLLESDPINDVDQKTMLLPALTNLFEGEYAEVAAIYFPAQRKRFREIMLSPSAFLADVR